MAFDPNLKQSDILINDDICQIFKCSPQGGMRRSKRTNSLVIVSDHTKSIYEDRWEKDIFHYTGMGLNGDQSLSFAQNKTLNESQTNGVDVFLFEVFGPFRYFYQGRVMLAAKPYVEKQPDIKQNIRNVWIFPLKLMNHTASSIIPEDVFHRKLAIREMQAKKSSDEALWKKVQSAPRICGVRHIVSKQYDRNQDVVEFVKRRANGFCQLCKNAAPFNKKDGEPFLEIHHIKWLSQGGNDAIDNTVALCPNCHRKMHALNLEKDIITLCKRVKL